MKIPYRDLSVSDCNLRSELLQAVDRVLSHGKIVLGPETEEFERKIAQFCKRKYAVGLCSGTTALYFALRSLDVGPGVQVVTTPLSWIATLNAVALCGAQPVFVDIKEDLNINVDLIEDAITEKTKVILPVHFTGKLCNMPQITEIAKKYNLHVIEDAAQSFGACDNGIMAGSFGDIGCFSMNPMKVLNAYGEAGVAVTDSEIIYRKLISLRYLGTINKENCLYPSYNGKIDTIQAAMLLVNLKYLSKKIKSRREIAGFYTQSLKDIVVCPQDNKTNHVYYLYTILAPSRDELKQYLFSRGIETQIHHPKLMPNNTAYQYLPKFNMPVAEDLIGKILCLPNQETLTLKETRYVVECIKDFYGGS